MHPVPFYLIKILRFCIRICDNLLIFAVEPIKPKIMKKLFTILLLMLALTAQAQHKQISFVEETKNWYYVYDEAGKKIGGLSRGSIGELKGWGGDFLVAKFYSFYRIYDAKGKVLKVMNVSDVGEIVGVSGQTITSKKGSWIYTWNKEGKKISVRSRN